MGAALPILTLEGRAFIDGQYCAAQGGATFECLSPVDGRFLANVASTDQADADHAVAVARQAFASGVWSGKAPAERKRILIRFAELILEHQEELALLETLDMGKPISDSLAIDIPATANAIRWNAEAIDKLYDEVAATPHDQLGLVTREPSGVVAAIVPWNFPLIMASWKFAPALAVGNSFILKPSEKSPLTAIRIAQLALDAGIPKGVFNVLPGYGHTVGKALALHMDVDVLAFTGSTAVGKQLLQYSGQSNMKRVWLEAGGKSANVVFADAPDLGEAARAAAAAIAFNQGEVCTAGSRLLVQASIREQFLPLLVEALKAWQPGHALDPASRVGAVVDERQLDNVLRYIGIGREQERAAVGRWCAHPARHRRPVCRADHLRRCDQRHDHRPRGDLRPGAGGDRVRQRGTGVADRQRQHLRPGRCRMDPRPQPRPSLRPGPARR